MTYDETDLYAIAELSAGLQVDGHRSDIVILKTALAHAAYAGRDRINKEDILIAASLALPHRLKKQPFQETELRFQELEEKLAEARAELTEDQKAESVPVSQASVSPVKKKSLATRQKLPAKSPTGLL